MKATNWAWFNNSGGCIGVVLSENEYEQQAYISSVSGHDEKSDIKFIMEWGSKLNLSQAEGFFPSYVNSETYAETL